MKKKPASRSAFFNPRVLTGFALCAIGVFCALIAFARQNQSSVQELTQSNAAAPESRHAATATVADVEATAKETAQPDVIAATFVVNTTTDTADAAPGDGACLDGGGACSLRAAISEANALAGTDTITLPAGTYTITLVAAKENLMPEVILISGHR